MSYKSNNEKQSITTFRNSPTYNSPPSAQSKMNLTNLPQGTVLEIAKKLEPGERKKIMFLNKSLTSAFNQQDIENTRYEVHYDTFRKTMVDIFKNVGDFMMVFYFEKGDVSESRNTFIPLTVKEKIAKYGPYGEVNAKREFISFQIRKGFFQISVHGYVDIAKKLYEVCPTLDTYDFQGIDENEEWDPENGVQRSWWFGGWMKPSEPLIGYATKDYLGRSVNVLELVFMLIDTYKLKLASVPSVSIASGDKGQAHCHLLHGLDKALLKKCLEGRAKVVKAYRNLNWYRVIEQDKAKRTQISSATGGSDRNKKKYNSRWYTIRTGKKGGKYILVPMENGKKKKIYV